MKSPAQRERRMLAGLFLSKFSQEGLRHLGFSTFAEAYNTMGFALGTKPTSIKNYMQEFDPLFPNGRKGWHGREMRQDRFELFERFGHLSLDGSQRRHTFEELVGRYNLIIDSCETDPSLKIEVA